MRYTTPSTSDSTAGRVASGNRSAIGSDSTHWRNGRSGSTSLASSAAVSAMRLAPHDGQKPRFLQLIANRIWDPFTYDFTAGAPTLTLDFQARLAVPGTNVFSALDNVSIVEQSTVIPLPAAGWLLLSGVGLLATLQRRRGQNAAHG